MYKSLRSFVNSPDLTSHVYLLLTASSTYTSPTRPIPSGGDLNPAQESGNHLPQRRNPCNNKLRPAWTFFIQLVFFLPLQVRIPTEAPGSQGIIFPNLKMILLSLWFSSGVFPISGRYASDQKCFWMNYTTKLLVPLYIDGTCRKPITSSLTLTALIGIYFLPSSKICVLSVFLEDNIWWSWRLKNHENRNVWLRALLTYLPAIGFSLFLPYFGFNTVTEGS